MPLVLIVDDEERTRNVLHALLKVKRYEVIMADNGTHALEILRSKHVDLMLTDVRMTPMDGIELLKQVREIDPSLPVVVMTAYGTISSAAAAVKMGAFDYVTKPIRIDDLIEVVENALDSTRDDASQREKTLPSSVNYQFGKIIAESIEMQGVCREIEKAAVTTAPSLLCGEIGTGKSLIAEAIHECSPRKKGEFAMLNCAEVPEPVLNLQLFGPPETAAAPAADKSPEGLLAPIGRDRTILLDEMTLMPPLLLEKLTLHLARAGGGKSDKPAPNIGLILAADTTLNSLSQIGGFAGLLSRISGVKIEVEPLRERKTDILPLLAHFLHELTGDWNKLPTLAPDAYAVFRHYPWPGNITELAERVNELFPRIKEGRITKDMLPPDMIQLAETGMPISGKSTPRSDQRGKSLKAFLRTQFTKKMG